MAMAGKNDLCVENRIEFSEEEQRVPRRESFPLPGSFASEVDEKTSDYSSVNEQPITGRVQERRSCRIKPDEGPLANDIPLTENDLPETCKEIGRDWTKLGIELGFNQNALHDIEDTNHNSNLEKAHALLVRYIQREGRDATKGKLARALYNIGRRDIAEKLVEFPIKTSEGQNFNLKEVGRFENHIDQHRKIVFFICQNVDGKLYLVRKLEGTGYEESIKTIVEEDGIADRRLKVLDTKGIAKAERERKLNNELEEIQNNIAEREESLKKIKASLESQERQVDKIDVPTQLKENEKLHKEMQMATTALVQLTGIVGQLKNSFQFSNQLYVFSVDLTATHQDLKERVKMLLDLTSGNGDLLDARETVRLTRLLDRCKSLEKEIKMREKCFERRFGELTIEAQQRKTSPSDPTPRPRLPPVERPIIRRASTQPVSESDLRFLREQVSPPDDPMNEAVEDSWSSNC